MSTVWAIVLSAGGGARFGGPKQFQQLRPGLRLVDVAVDSALRNTDHVVLVVPPSHDWTGPGVRHVVSGGESRFESVRNGLGAIPHDADVVIIHDAAHPLAPDQVFSDLVAAIRAGADGAVPFHPLADVVKSRTPDGRLSTVGRDGLGVAQMPMGFKPAALRESHEAVIEANAEYREDSALLEQMGMRVVAVEGSSRNIHVVTQADLDMARLLARNI